MSDDLIKRSDAIKAVRSTVAQYVPFLNGINMTLPLECETALRSVPSADRPQGEWIDMGDFEQCSVCKGTRLKEFQSYYGKTTWVKTPYCPNCGADMRGEQDG